MGHKNLWRIGATARDRMFSMPTSKQTTTPLGMMISDKGKIKRGQ